jgi:hypothetical protein
MGKRMNDQFSAWQGGRNRLIDDPKVDEVRRAQSVRFTAELVCLLCGRMHGSLDGGSSWPPRGAALLYRPGGEQPTPVMGWWRLRCATCGGALMANELTCHSVRPGATVD